MPPSVKVKRKRHMKIPKKISGPKNVHVGFPDGKAEGDIIDRAVWNHYGTPNADFPIPARPFLMNAIRGNKRTYRNALKTSAAKILRGEVTTRTVLNKLGILSQGHIQAEITNLRSPPNAQATIDAKKSSNPLIDDGEMRGAVTWAVQE